MKLQQDFVDRVYEFAGLWGVPSVCGLKIVKRPDRHVVIATELWDQNPGTSITNFCAQLASRLCSEFDLDPARLVFIEHCPESGSHLEIYQQTFDRVDFDCTNGRLSNPDWTRLSRAEVESLVAPAGH
jgi:hypothetical protein